MIIIIIYKIFKNKWKNKNLTQKNSFAKEDSLNYNIINLNNNNSLKISHDNISDSYHIPEPEGINHFNEEKISNF